MGAAPVILALAACAQVETRAERKIEPPAAPAPWLRAETEHFVVYSELGEQATRRDAAELESFRDFVAWAMPAADERPGKLDVYLVDRREELARVLPGKSFASLYQAATNATLALVLGKGGSLSEENALSFTLLHAVVEHFAFCGRPYPAWLSAAWAEIYGELIVETDTFPHESDTLGERYSALLESRPPVEVVLRDDPNGPTRTPRFYQQAWLVLRWLRNDEARREELSLYVRDVCGGADPVKAMTEQAGMSLAEIQQTLGDLARKLMPPILGREVIHAVRKQEYPVVEPLRDRDRASYDRFVDSHATAAAAVTVTAMPRSAQDLLPELLRLELNAAQPGDGFLEDVRGRAARWPGDRLAELTLARAEVAIGDAEAGAARAARFLEAHADDAEAMEIRALGLIKTGNDSASRRAQDFAEAHRLLARATKLAPDRYQVFWLFGETALAGAYSAEGVNALVRAHELAPTLTQITLAAAKGLAHLHRSAEEARLLDELARDPRAIRERPEVEELLSTLRRRPGLP